MNRVVPHETVRGIMPDAYVDARGLSCPMPLLKAKLALNAMLEGQILHVVATDSGSWGDIPAYVAKAPHELLSAHEDDAKEYHFVIKKLS